MKNVFSKKTQSRAIVTNLNILSIVASGHVSRPTLVVIVI